MDWYSPLFRQASKAILDAAKQEFRRTMVGQLVSEVHREASRAYSSPERLGHALHRYSRYGAKDALRDLRGTQFGQFAREIERYSRQDSELKQLLKGFLSELGPAGKLIQALTGTGPKGELDRLIKVMQAFGFEVLPHREDWKRGHPVTERGLEAAQELLETMGAKVIWPGSEPITRDRDKRLPFGIPLHDEHGRQREEVALPMADGPAQRFGMHHPIVTGEMVKAKSSNVHSFGYDIEGAYLYVRFLGYVRGTRGPDGHPLRAGPGSLYRYGNVTPEEFLTLLAANSKGDWVWDHLRIRGTWSGHQKDYELVGIEGGYVPRKATVRLNQQTRQMEEWFVQRRVRMIGGGWMTSALQPQGAGPVPWGEIDRGRPETGRPDGPDRGAPDRGW